ncbi:MAG: S1-like domain-containing RNA-binding protein, partial [Bacteroidales bacterium]|nr:S1-like domain-containing RNA-binding protein [Bacteroidales bacterium]
MALAGQLNTLEVVKIVDFGVYLDGENLGEILLPSKWLPKNCQPGDKLEVFLYFDSNDRIIATTTKPAITVNQFGMLRVVDVNNVGAFLDMGLDKDLLVPYREQKMRMEVGKHYLVFVYLDEESNRIAASAKIEQFLDLTEHDYKVGQEVDLIIWAITEIGFKAIIDHKHEGLLYKNEVFQSLRPGQHIKGYISNIREDGKIDLTLQKAGYEKIDEFSQSIIEILKKRDGFLPVTDKSNATEIYSIFKMSKKNFKKSIGA